jgi:hypothetical protein
MAAQGEWKGVGFGPPLVFTLCCWVALLICCGGFENNHGIWSILGLYGLGSLEFLHNVMAPPRPRARSISEFLNL